MSTSTDGRRHAAWLFDPQDLICKDGEDNTWDCTYVDASLVDTVYIYEYNRASTTGPCNSYDYHTATADAGGRPGGRGAGRPGGWPGEPWARRPGSHQHHAAKTSC